MNYSPFFLSKIKHGDKKALHELYVDLFPRLVSFAYNYAKDKTACEDIVQNVLLKFWENRQTIDINCSIKSLLYTSVKNSTINYIKKRANDRLKVSEIEWLETERFAEHYAYQEEIRGNLFEAIKNLPEKCKEVVMLSLYQNTVSDIKEILDISENTVKYHKKRAYSLLRDALKLFF